MILLLISIFTLFNYDNYEFQIEVEFLYITNRNRNKLGNWKGEVIVLNVKKLVNKKTFIKNELYVVPWGASMGAVCTPRLV